MKQTLYINLYRAGWWHKQGKPNTTNLHAGDVYTTEALALENADPDKGYVTTAPFEVDFPGAVLANGPQSVPMSLSISRSLFLGDWSHSLLPYLASSEPAAFTPSLEVGDGHYGVGYAEWQAKHGNPAASYKPSHGGYPATVPYHRIPQP